MNTTDLAARVSSPNAYGLPNDKASLYSVVRNLERLRTHFGLTHSDVAYLRYAVDCASHDDIAAGREPWFYERVDDVGARLGCGRRSVYNIEKRLHEKGFIIRAPMANGHRGARRDPQTGALQWVHGVSLAPLLARSEELGALAAQLEREEQAYRKARQEAHQTRARLLEAVAQGESESVSGEAQKAALSALAAAPDRIERGWWPLSRLQGLIESMRVALSYLLDEIVKAASLQSQNQKDSHAWENNDGHLYNNTNPNSCSCNKSERPIGRCLENKEADRPPKTLAPSVGAESSEKIDALPPQIALAIAPEPWREALEGVELQDWRSIGYAAEVRRERLGVSTHAWKTAIQTMGGRAATVALIVLDANRSHPTTPVKSVGGALVAMTRRARVGQLRLFPAVKAIAARVERNQQVVA